MKIFPKIRLTVTILAMGLSALAFAQTSGGRQISGKVVDENGETLIGAGVVSKDGKRGAVTDVNGKYTISVLPSDDVLLFSYLGYSTQEVKIGGKNNIDVILLPDATNTLNDVVVIGYGAAKKQDLTGSVANVKMSDIAEVPVLNVDQALQGRIAGVDIMSTTGEPGASTSIRIRGTRSVEASNEPLIVVDGVMDAVDDLGDLNSDDIESISVLKDASSTAIYGSRGANGVIMVTTKKGVSDKPTIKLKANFGISQITKHLDIMNAEEFLRYRNDYYYFNGGMKETYSARRDIETYNNDTDWIDAITHIAPYQNYQLTMSGNSKGNNYYGSLSYSDKEGIILNTGEKRITGRFNYTKSIVKWLSAGLKLSTTYRKIDKNKAYIGGSNIHDGAMYLSPIIGLYDDVNPLNEDGTLINTPYACTTMETYYSTSWKSNLSGLITITPIKGLTIKSQNSVYTNHAATNHFWPNTLPKRRPAEGADGYKYSAETVKLSSENTVTYKKSLGHGHKIDAMAGYSASSQSISSTSAKAKGLIMDELMWNNLNGIGSKENYTVESGLTKIVRQSVFGRFNYNYKSRYYLTATLRADGSSNFAANRKWGLFPSGALKWNIKKEPFMKKVRWVNDLSLRVSAGRSGNDAVSAYRSLEAYSSTTDSYIFDGSQGVSYYPSRLDNPNLTWEKTDQYNAAIEASFFRKRLSINIEGYYSRTSDLLLSVQTISSTGYTSRFQNLGLTSNKGMELTIESRNIEKRKFGWTTTFTISRNRQMVEDLGTEEYLAKINSPVSSLMMYGYKAGYPLNALWGLENGGCFHNQNEIDAVKDPNSPDYRKYICYGSNVTLGAQRVVDQNRDGSLGMDDVIYLGQADPEFYGGLQNNFHIGQLKIGFFFAYSYGGCLYNYSELYMGGSYRTNQYRYMLNSWHPVRNPDSDTPRAGYSQVMLPSSNYVHDASYIRLKDINIQYTFDLRKTRVIKDLTVGLSGNNLYLWSRYNGFDPDVSTETDDSSLRRVDKNSYPTSRQIVMSLSLRF